MLSANGAGIMAPHRLPLSTLGGSRRSACFWTSSRLSLCAPWCIEVNSCEYIKMHCKIQYDSTYELLYEAMPGIPVNGEKVNFTALFPGCRYIQ